MADTAPGMGTIFRRADAPTKNWAIVSNPYTVSGPGAGWVARARLLGTGTEVWISSEEWPSVLLGPYPLRPEVRPPPVITHEIEQEWRAELDLILRRLRRFGPKTPKPQPKLGLQHRGPTSERVAVLEAVRDTSNLLLKILEQTNGSE